MSFLCSRFLTARFLHPSGGCRGGKGLARLASSKFVFDSHLMNAPAAAISGTQATIALRDVVAAAEQSLAECQLAASESADLNNPGRLRRIELAMDRLLRVCRQFESDESLADQIKEARTKVRTLMKPFLDSGPLGNEIVNWPRGPGSSTAMGLAYEGLNLPTHTPRAHYAEWYVRTRDLVLAVRSRKDTLRGLLQDELKYQSSIMGEETISVLDLANGPIQSLKEVIQGKLVPRDVLERVSYRGYDTDSTTQDANKLWIQENKVPGDFAFHTASAVETPFLRETLSNFNNIVYSTGFFDYLPDDKLKSIWKSSYNSLKPGGALIISLKDSNKYDAQGAHYLVKWDQFLQRSEGEFLDLLEESGLETESCTCDDTGIILFYVVRKPLVS